MRAEAICRASQKMSDHRVAHIFRVARAFTPKSQHIALSQGGAKYKHNRSLKILDTGKKLPTGYHRNLPADF